MDVLNFTENLKGFVLEIQEGCFLLWKALTNIFSTPFYLEDLIEQLDSIGIGSLPVILLTSFFTGAVFALQTIGVLKQYGTTATMGQLVAFTMIRELGPVLTALMFTGRVGAGIASELGGMVVSQQVDALRSLGTDYMKKLVTPRLLACLISLPLLTAICDFVSIWSGYFLTWTEVNQSVHVYWQSVKDNLVFHDLYYSVVKAIVFAVVVAIVSCYQGIKTSGGTRGIGQSTTRSVVISSIFIITCDFFLTKGIGIIINS